LLLGSSHAVVFGSDFCFGPTDGAPIVAITQSSARRSRLARVHDDALIGPQLANCTSLVDLALEAAMPAGAVTRVPQFVR
jgi:hypothetical protein